MNEDGTFPDEPLSHTCNDTVGTCYLKHIYTMDQPETYDMVYQWRDLLDAYTKQHKTETKILMTEAYTSLKQNQLFYGDDSGRRGSQVIFNFLL